MSLQRFSGWTAPPIWCTPPKPIVWRYDIDKDGNRGSSLQARVISARDRSNEARQFMYHYLIRVFVVRFFSSKTLIDR